MSEEEQSCPVPLVVPVVFVPGIMGSRLKNASTGEVVWSPGPTQAVQWMTSVQSVSIETTETWIPVPYVDVNRDSMTPARRKELMVGSSFSESYLAPADDNGQMPSSYSGEKLAEALRRGYGGLAWEFYGEFMEWLEKNLTAALDDFPPECDNIKIEQFAFPYNWTASNETAGSGLATYITNDVLPRVTELHGDRDVEILDPIVVTHSMGGLVARSFAKLSGGEGMVHGIIHGAMPTHGSPAAYKRMRAGFEGGSFTNAAVASVAEDMETRNREDQNAIVRFFNDSYEGWQAMGRGAMAAGTGYVSMSYLGSTAAEVTALLANMPGGLQLLPNQYHEGRTGRRDWLRISYASNGDILRLPRADPFREIYAKRDTWWRLVDPALIDPGGNASSAWSGFVARLGTVKSWHQRLHGAGGFHANTKMFWSGSSLTPCFETVEWKAQSTNAVLQGRMASSTTMPEADNQIGGVAFLLGQESRFLGLSTRDVIGTVEIQPPQDPGDGTVHTGSGLRVPSSIESDPTVNSRGTYSSYTHDGAYNDDFAREQVASWMSDMILHQLDARGLN